MAGSKNRILVTRFFQKKNNFAGMIYQSLSFLAEQLQQYFKLVEKTNANITNNFVQLKNVAHLTEEEIKNVNNVYLTLVNIAEETTMKNVPDYVRQNDQIVYRNSPQYLNLYVLFSSCVANSYDHALIYLSHIIHFFQGKNTFTTQNSVTAHDGLGDFRLILDLYSPTFEQVNYLWSTLGGKQFPHVLYKIRIVEIIRDSTTESRGTITEIQVKNALN
jgi:hypothetical protein